MKRILIRCLFGLVLCAAVASDTNPRPKHDTRADANRENRAVEVAKQGVTELNEAFSRNKISVKITTLEVDIGEPSDPWPEKKLTSCTYSRFPCSLVNDVEVAVDGNDLFVARSVYADLADINWASLREKRAGRYILTMNGGDASESYTAEVEFDEKMVRRREFISNFNEQVVQRTEYFLLKDTGN